MHNAFLSAIVDQLLFKNPYIKTERTHVSIIIYALASF